MIQRTFQQAVDQYGAMEFKNEAALRKAVSQGDGDMSQIDAMLEKQPAPADKGLQKPEPDDKAKKRSVELKVADKRPKPKYKKKDGTLKSTKDAEAVNKRFSDAVAEASKKTTPRSKAKLEAQVKKSEDRREGAPPIVTPEDYARQSPTMSAKEHAAQLQHIGEQNVGEDNLRSHLESAGVYEASPKQLKQFAQMLGIDVWGAVTTPEQLRAAIDVHGKHENLYAILRKNGLMSQEPETKPSFSEAAGTALGDFAKGLESNLPTGLARRAAKAGLGMLSRGRFQAEQSYGAQEVARIKQQTQTQRYAAEYPLASDDDLWAGRQWKEQGAERSDMTPDEYLNQVRPLEADDESEETIAALIEHMEGGGKLDPLWIYGQKQPHGYRKEDGRHRAHAAKKLGMSSVPVLTWPEKEATQKPDQFAAFNESDHPRADDGKFTAGQQTAASTGKKPSAASAKQAMVDAGVMRAADTGKKSFVDKAIKALPRNQWLTGYQVATKSWNVNTAEARQGIIKAVKDLCKAGIVEKRWNADGQVLYAWKGTKPSEGLLTEAEADAKWPAEGSQKEKPGIVMPSDDVSNEDAAEGDQLGLFGEGKKKKVPKQYRQENPQGKARAKSLFDKNEDPDQQTLFSSFGEAVEHYAVNEKKK